MNKLKLWNQYPDWDSAEQAWDKQAAAASQSHPIKTLSSLPQIPGITPETAHGLKWKALKWMVQYDEGFKIFKQILRHPLKYLFRLIRSYLKGKSYHRDGDFFLYNLKQPEDLTSLFEKPNTLLVVGFSYCQKPFECPSKRFTPDCVHDLSNPVCQQCFIGKTLHALPEKNVIPLIIPTIHYIGNEIFNLVHQHPNKEILFLITACEMTLEMFGDWGNMAGIKGIGVRLDGRICNTMKAFELSEQGIKPGLTVVTNETEKRIINILKKLWLIAQMSTCQSKGQ